MTTTNELVSAKKDRTSERRAKKTLECQEGCFEEREYKGWRENGGRHRYNVQPERQKRMRDTLLTSSREGVGAGCNLSGGESERKYHDLREVVTYSYCLLTCFVLFCLFLSHLRAMTSGVARQSTRERRKEPVLCTRTCLRGTSCQEQEHFCPIL